MADAVTVVAAAAIEVAVAGAGGLRDARARVLPLSELNTDLVPDPHPVFGVLVLCFVHPLVELPWSVSPLPSHYPLVSWAPCFFLRWVLQSEVVAKQTMKGRGPNRSIPESGSLGSGGMTVSQLYPLYDRLVSVRVGTPRSADDAYGCSQGGWRMVDERRKY